MNFEEFHKPQSDTRAQEEFVDFLERSQAFSFHSAPTSKLPRQTRNFFLLKKLPPASSCCGAISCNVRRKADLARDSVPPVNLHPGSGANRRIITVIKSPKASHKVQTLQHHRKATSSKSTYRIKSGSTRLHLQNPIKIDQAHRHGL
jgi:hypothetical protein